MQRSVKISLMTNANISIKMIASQPRTVFKSRNHQVITDKEDVKERSWISGGKVNNITKYQF